MVKRIPFRITSIQTQPRKETSDESTQPQPTTHADARTAHTRREREREREREKAKRRTRHKPAFLAGLVALSLLFCSASAFALLVGDDGLIEPIIVQIKESLRTSLDLDAQLATLATLEKEYSLGEVEWYAGPKLLVKLSFPKESTDDEALKAISALQESQAVEKVVVQSAANLEFKSADFVRSWKPGEIIPDAARRGFDVDRLNRPPIVYDEKTELPSMSPTELSSVGKTNTFGTLVRPDSNSSLPRSMHKPSAASSRSGNTQITT